MNCDLPISLIRLMCNVMQSFALALFAIRKYLPSASFLFSSCWRTRSCVLQDWYKPFTSLSMNNNKRKANDGMENGGSSPTPDDSVKLILGNDTLLVEREKLSQISSYFRSMFARGNYQEDHSRSITIQTPKAEDIQCAHRVLIAALYDGIQLHVDEENAEQILRVAHYFDLTAVISKASEKLKTAYVASCDPFLEQVGKFVTEITSADELKDFDSHVFRDGYNIWRVARDLGVDELQQVVLAKLQVHMGFLVHPSVFKLMDCTFDEVLALLSGSCMGVESEKIILDAVLAWCSHERLTRWNIGILSRLLLEIRWEHVEEAIRTLMILAQDPLPTVLKSILKDTQPPFTQNPPALNRNLPSSQRHFDEFLFIMHSQKRQLFIGQYRPRNDYLHEKNPVVDSDVEEYEPWMLVVERQIWMSVKRKNGQNNMVTFHPETSRFQRLPLSMQISLAPVLQLPSRLPPLYGHGHVYHLDRKGRMMWRCDAEGHGGQFGFNLPHQLRNETGWDFWDGHIYVCSRFTVQFGTENGANSPPCGRIDKFSLDSELWTECSPAGTGNRSVGFMSIKAHNGYIYATGGKYLKSTTASCYRYHLATGMWARFARLRHARREHATFVVNDRLYVIGGFGDRNLPVTTMEMYDDAKDYWLVIRDRVYATGVAVLRMKAFATVKVEPAEDNGHLDLEEEEQ